MGAREGVDGAAMNQFESVNVLFAMNEGGGEMMNMLLLMGGMGLIIFFTMIRPGQKERKEKEAFLTALTKGQKVVTAGGLYGKIVEVNEATVNLEIAPKTSVTMDKSVITRLAVKPDAQAASK